MKRLGLLFAVAGLANAQQQSAFGQCGGIGYTGASSCVTGYVCSTQNAYYAQCTPGSSASTTPATTTQSTPSVSPSPSPSSTSTSSVGPTSSALPPPGSGGVVKYAGVNIAGFDFGCSTDGTCNLGGYYDIVADLNPTGIQQMDHLASLGLNAFRLPIGWQNMVDGVVGGPLNDTALTDYYLLVSACLAVAKWCEIDVHNYARWDGEIIGQGGPTNAQFASLWSQIATKYADVSNIVFGIMNEPHDLPSITTWAGTVQAAVTAIREAGATSQYILLPGDDYTSAEQFVSGGSADALNAVTNPDGSKTGLIMDVHKYLDADNSGTTGDCVTNNIDDAFAPLATWLRANNRQAFLSESGAGNNAQCETDFCQQLAYLNANSDVYLGWTGWAAGGFAGQNYVLSEVPTLSNGVWTDTPIVTQCIVGEFLG